MQSTTSPTRISIPFARDGSRRNIPNTSQIGVVNGAASFPDGFPPLTFIPKETGGIPPAGVDFNGVLYMLTDILRYQTSGGVFKYDAEQSSAIGGYPKGAFLLKGDATGMWRSTVENNTSNPDTGGAGWIDVDTWLQLGTGAVRQNIQDTFRRLVVCPRQFGARGLPGVDDTAAFNACFKYAELNYLTVEVSDGEYTVGNLFFGNQATTVQATAPLGLIGKSRGGFRLKAKVGGTGTLLQAWSCAGVAFKDFSVTTVGTAMPSIDWEWKPGVGPSTQNAIERVRVDGGTALVAVNLDNLNDTYPRELSVSVPNSNICCISARQSGGLTIFNECIWNQGYLRIACQNGMFNGCWGFGVELLPNAVNNIGFIGCYMYPNVSHGNSNVWSQSFAAFAGAHSLTFGPGTQIITSDVNSTSGVLDVNLYSSARFIDTEFITLGGNIPMWGPNCRKDAVQNATVHFEGGSYSNMISMAEPAGFDISYVGLINKFTQLAYRNSTKNYFAQSGNSANFAANTWYTLVPTGTMVAGVYVLNLTWEHNGAGIPFIVRASALVTSPSITDTIAGSGVDVIGSVSEFRPSLKTAVKFRLTATGDTKTPQIDFQCTSALPSPGTVSWTLTKIG